jgi:prevent-host-death family protein
MKQVNMHEAKTHLSRLIEEVEAGKVVTITKAGKPVATLSPITRKGKPRKLGLLDGKFKIPEDFDAALPASVQAAFEGRR